MKDITELSKEMNGFFSLLQDKLVKAQQHATDDMYQDALERIEIPQEARNTSQFIAYRDSIKVQKVELEDNEIKSSVYSDLVVGGYSKWADVPVGAFLEWGTGPLGEGSNTYEHGYDYTTLAPWDFHTWLQFQQTGNWGIVARPHLYPALINIQPIFEANIKEAIQEAWTK